MVRESRGGARWEMQESLEANHSQRTWSNGASEKRTIDSSLIEFEYLVCARRYS